MVTTETSRLKLQTEKMLLHGICVRSQALNRALQLVVRASHFVTLFPGSLFRGEGRREALGMRLHILLKPSILFPGFLHNFNYDDQFFTLCFDNLAVYNWFMVGVHL